MKKTIILFVAFIVSALSLSAKSDKMNVLLIMTGVNGLNF